MLKTVAFLMVAAGSLFTCAGQQSCNLLPITITKTGRVGVFNNTTLQCAGWRFSYYSEGFSALSIELDGAPDSNGSPGTWAAITAATPCSFTGSNPMTATTSGTALFSNCYFPWISINVTSATGTGSIVAGANGLNTAASNTGGAAGSGGSFLSGTTDPGVPAVPTIKQANSSITNTGLGTAATLAYVSNVTLGNDSVVAATCQNAAIASVTDSLGTAYASVGSNGNFAVWRGTVGSSAADTITVNGTGGCANIYIGLQEVAGSNHTLDGSISIVTTTGGPPGFTTIFSSDLLMVGTSVTNCNAVFTATAPTIKDASSSGTGSIAVGNLTTTAAGAYTPSLTNTQPGCGQNSYTFALQAVPVASPGNNGDFYINLTSGVLFGPKTAGNWPNAGWHWIHN